MTVLVMPVEGIGEVTAESDLASLLLGAAPPLADGDVLVVSSKIVSKAEGRTVAAADRDAAIDAQTVRLVASRRTPRGVARIVEAAAGPVMAAAGVDASNVAPGTVLLLPVDPDASAAALLAALRALGAPRIGVVLSDTAGRAWRDGQVDFALGSAGVTVTEDLRGTTDTHGQLLEVTVRAVVDELAAAADLVKGKLAGVPAAVVRGTSFVGDAAEPAPGAPPPGRGAPAAVGAAALLRAGRDDWFRLGHVEAVRAALGVDPAGVEPPAVPRAPLETRLRRALEIAVAAPSPFGAPSPGYAVEVEVGGGSARVSADPADPLALGALAQRIAAAAWSEDLRVSISPEPGGVGVTATDA